MLITKLHNNVSDGPSIREETNIPERLKAVRKLYGLSQRELSRLAGVTNSSISLIEKGEISPSISSLKKILDGFPISLADFFTFDLSSSPHPFYRAQELKDLGDGMIHYFLLGADRKDRNITILREIYPPGSNTGDTLLTHNGEEGGIIIRGQITLTVGGETQVMKPGDGYYFSSHIPHRFSNDRKDDCEIISANSPPSV